MKKRILSTAILTSSLLLAACSPGTENNTNTARNSCQNWKKEEHGEEKCVDKKSSYHGYYLFNGMLYGSQSSLLNSNAYQSTVNGAKAGDKPVGNTKNNNSRNDGKGKNESKGTQNNGKSNSNATQKGKGGGNSNGGLRGGFGSGSRGSGAS